MTGLALDHVIRGVGAAAAVRQARGLLEQSERLPEFVRVEVKAALRASELLSAEAFATDSRRLQ